MLAPFSGRARRGAHLLLAVTFAALAAGYPPHFGRADGPAAEKLPPGEARYRFADLMQGYLETYRLAEGLRFLEGWLRQRPNDTEALYWRGRLKELAGGAGWGNGPDGKDLTDYRRVLEFDPNHAAARRRLAAGLFQDGRHEEALAEYQALARRRPTDAAVLLGLARCHVALGEAEKAGQFLDRLEALAPPAASALTARATLFLRQGKPAQAEKCLRQALARDPADAVATYTLAQCLQASGQGAEARETFARFRRVEAGRQRLREILRQAALVPAGAAQRVEAGLILTRLGAEAEARRWLESALVADPQYKPAHQALADCYQRAGKQGLAEHHRRLAQ
jgi:Tfp pilus assembly protein PilF